MFQVLIIMISFNKKCMVSTNQIREKFYCEITKIGLGKFDKITGVIFEDFFPTSKPRPVHLQD